MRHQPFSIVICLIGAVAISLVAPAAGHAETYESEKFEYSLEIPEGWSAIDPDGAPPRFDQMAQILNDETYEGDDSVDEMVTEVDFIASLGGAPASVQSPSFAVFVSPEPTAWVNPLITHRQMVQALETEVQNRGQTPNTRNVDIARNFDGLEVGDVISDRDNVEVMTVYEEAWGYNLAWIKQGHDYVATMMFMVPHEQWEPTADARQTLYETYQFSPDQQVKSDTARKVGRVIGYVCGLLCLVLVPLGLGGWWWWKRSQDDEQESVVDDIPEA